MFDLDGTLVDSMDCYHAVFVDTFSEFGLPLVKKAEMLALMRHGRNILDTLIPADWPDREATQERCRQMFRTIWADRAATGVTLHPDAPAVLSELHRRGLKLGLATGAQGPWIVRLLELNALAPFFDAVITHAEVAARKPAPDLLLACMEKLQAQPQRSVYVGDSPIDIIAAKAAGVRAIGVLSGASDRAALEEPEPDLILEHVGQLPAVFRT